MEFPDMVVIRNGKAIDVNLVTPVPDDEHVFQHDPPVKDGWALYHAISDYRWQVRVNQDMTARNL